MELTQRQEKILEKIVQDYIELASPISSQFLDKKYKFGISPATIRIEFQRLTKKGYLYQPHTSAGRIPTDKGYRFFVDKILEKEIEDFEIGDWFEKDFEDTIKFIQEMTKKLASLSQALALSYFKKEKIFWKEGWEEILREPEFREKDLIFNFVEFLKDFERNIEELKINSKIKVYIGKENPFKKAREFSIISSKCYLPDGGDAIISLLGPKRMRYSRNISLMNSLMKLLEKF
jgi:heat-inducible transcriptional repressor